jgi:hypothetical protein
VLSRWLFRRPEGVKNLKIDLESNRVTVASVAIKKEVLVCPVRQYNNIHPQQTTTSIDHKKAKSTFSVL